MKDNKLKKVILKFRANFYRIGLKNRSYTVISNNYWGGVITRNFGLQYNSPTCGTFFFSKEYIKFLKDLPTHLNAELEQVNVVDSIYKDYLLPKYGYNIVVGKVLDAEIVFLHYSCFEEAKQKWDRRKARVNYDNMVVKYNDQNKFEVEDYYEFEKLPFNHKIFFTANTELKAKEGCIFFSEFEKQGYVVDDIKTSKKYFDAKKYLNSMI